MLQRLRQINDFRDLRTKNNMIYLFMFKMKLPRQMMELSPQLTQLLYLRDFIMPLSENGGNDARLRACGDGKGGWLDAAPGGQSASQQPPAAPASSRLGRK